MSKNSDQREYAKQSGKEVKIGLGILATLVIALGVVLLMRLTGGSDVPTASIGGGNETEKATPSDEPTQPTLLQSKPYSAKTIYNEQADSPEASWTTIAQNKSSEDENPTRSFSSKAANSDRSGDDVEPSRIPDSKTIPSKAIPSKSNIPPAGRGYSTRYPSDDAFNASASQSIPPALASENLLRSVAARYAARPAQPNQLAQQQVQQTYDPAGAYVNADYRQSTEQVPISGNPYAQQQSQQQRFVAQQQQYQQQQLPPALAETSPVVHGKTSVRPGESMWSISRRVYGSSAFFKALAEHNRQRLPNSHDLEIGDEVLTPEVAVLRRRYPGLCPRERKRRPGAAAASMVSATMIRAGRTYVVEEGDTLYDIARYELGSGAQWPKIYPLNRRELGDDFDYLRPGTKLTLPARAASRTDDELVERPNQRPNQSFNR